MDRRQSLPMKMSSNVVMTFSLTVPDDWLILKIKEEFMRDRGIPMSLPGPRAEVKFHIADNIHSSRERVS
jgi:hypothetical protein